MKKNNESGFSLLEVIVALAIMSGGFLSVLQLFNMSIQSVKTSEEFTNATMLASSKMAELEMTNYVVEDLEGSFDYEGYRWELEISPYDSPLNNEDENIELSKIKLNVLWTEDSMEHSFSLSTIKLNSTIYPVSDRNMKRLFSGGNTRGGSNDDDTDSENSNKEEKRLRGGSFKSVSPISGIEQKPSNVKKPCSLLGAGSFC